MSIHKYKKKSGYGYKAVVQVSPTRQKSKRFDRKIDAQNWEAQTKTRIGNGDKSIAKSKMKLSELADYWLENHARIHKSPSSIKRDEAFLRHQILPSFGTVYLENIDSNKVEYWMNSLRVSLSTKSCNSALGLLKKMLNDATRWGFVAGNPIVKVQRFKQAEQDFLFWNKEEAISFLSKVKDTEHSCVYTTALLTGMRRGELAGLKWDCVDLNRRQITVKRSYCFKANALRSETKSKRIRRIPINKVLLDLLGNLKASAKSDMVFPDVDFNHIARTIKRDAINAGIKPIRFHDLRHSFASIFMMAGGSIYELQKILGHSSIRMTERYSHLAPDHLQGATDILNVQATP